MSIDASTNAVRFPKPIPFGWYSAGRVVDLPWDLIATGDQAGAVFSFQACGQELVAWHDGAQFRVADAFCPHLGAHLGVGGRVDATPEHAGCIVCPFHEWKFDGTGANTFIPFAERTNAKAKLRMYPTTEIDGHLRFWYHPDPAVEPMWEIPTLIDDAMVPCGAAEWTVASYWQEMAENSIDMAHFVSIHGSPGLGEVRSAVAEPAADGSANGPIRHVVNKTVYETPKGLEAGELNVDMYGPGTSVTTFALFGTIKLLSTTTPIDNGHCTIRMNFFHDGEELSAAIAPAFVKEVKRQFEQDVPIWENKRFVASPALAPYEKPITEFRAWATQFYATPGHTVSGTV
ncbi:aromatic ring-hydroxylating dioxygenase subunit alpha [Ilumatobacter sp.]|uniref:aromatic ring-hydroxylating oxygenase subunit alpha n=1 Tax=Ilumatobacter sp. TaxID=1967498 RepID=UPI003753AE51